MDETKDGDDVTMKEDDGKSAEELTDEPTGDSTTTSPTKKSDDNQASGKKSEARHAESRYAAVPISHMFCQVCNKHMWDGFVSTINKFNVNNYFFRKFESSIFYFIIFFLFQSFENHLRGRAHQLMMDKLDESYKLRVDFMRHELKVSEEQRELSLHNSKRRGKKVSKELKLPKIEYL